MNFFSTLGLPSQPWVETGATALIAIAVTVIVQRIGFALGCRWLPDTSTAGLFLRRMHGPLRFALPLLILQIVWDASPAALPLLALIGHLTDLAFIIALTWVAASCVSAAGEVMARLYPVTMQDNLRARRIQTHTRVLVRTLTTLIVIIGLATALITFPHVRQFGTSLLASAGLAGLVVGFAARPVFSNLIAGLQIALTQPIRIDDVLIVKGEWGRVEEITGAYVVIHIWDDRRLVVPLQWFIENPFENWTRASARILGTVFLWLDFRTPIDPLRAELERVCKQAPEWDGRVCQIVVTDANEHAMQIRALVSAVDSGKAWDLRCRVREALILFIQKQHPEYLPRVRAELHRLPSDGNDISPLTS